MNKLFVLVYTMSITGLSYINGADMNNNHPLPGSPSGWMHSRDRTGFKALEAFMQKRGHLIPYNPEGEKAEDLRYIEALTAERLSLKSPTLSEDDLEIKNLYKSRETDSPQTTAANLSDRSSTLSNRTTDVRSPLSPQSTSIATPISEADYLLEKKQDMDSLKEIDKIIEIIMRNSDTFNKNDELGIKIHDLAKRFFQGEYGVKQELKEVLEEGLKVAELYAKIEFDKSKNEENRAYLRRCFIDFLLPCKHNPEMTRDYNEEPRLQPGLYSFEELGVVIIG